MIIRKLKESDLDQMIYIEENTFSDPWTREDFDLASQKEGNLYLVGEIDGQVVGYVGCWGILDEGYIYNVAVDEIHRRKGIAHQLLQEVIRQMTKRGITSMTLEVRVSNLAAIALYESLGFVKAGIRKDFYGKPVEDAVIMWLDSKH